MRVHTVFFDFGRTLVDVPYSASEIWLEIMNEAGLKVDPGLLKRALEAADSTFLPQVYDYKGKMPKFWILYDAFVIDKLGLSDPEGKLPGTVEKRFQEPKWFHLYPETREVLESLKSDGYSMGLISGNTDDLLRQLDQLDLAKYFTTVTYSQEARAEKPNPAIYRLALKRAGCRPDGAVHVGDWYEGDVIGARGVGITPILIDRENKRPETNCLRITDLRQLKDVMTDL